MLGLPEIEVLRRDLEKEIVGRRIKDAEIRPGTNAMKIVRRHGRRKEFQELLVGGKVDRVDRVGRALLLELDNGRTMMVDLGKTGRLLKTSASEELAPHTHIVIGFTIGGQLRFVDPSLSGEVFVASPEEISADGMHDFAIDPLGSQPVTWQDFSGQLQARKAPLKDLLLDEGFICGLGPIYSDEVLFAAGLRYDRVSDALSSQDVRRLYRGLIETLQDAVRARGTTRGDQEWTDLQGNPGGYQSELKVYERAGEPCRRCRSAVIHMDYAGGLTYFCPQCQS
jgi:formamidopyrimidine-DNA glycosylase